MTDSPFDVVLFDLGGVLVELGGVAPMSEFSGIDDEDELWRRWLSCRWVRAFERGECDAVAFAAGVVADWDLAVSAEAMLESFLGWPRGPFAGAEELVVEVKQHTAVGCLSNTNELHCEGRFRQWPLVALFDHMLLSYELGVVKPDGELFEVVGQRVGLAPERILFLDDNQLNVDAAVAAGWHAVRVRGIEESRAALVSLGATP